MEGAYSALGDNHPGAWSPVSPCDHPFSLRVIDRLIPRYFHHAHRVLIGIVLVWAGFSLERMLMLLIHIVLPPQAVDGPFFNGPDCLLNWITTFASEPESKHMAGSAHTSGAMDNDPLTGIVRLAEERQDDTSKRFFGDRPPIYNRRVTDLLTPEGRFICPNRSS